MAVICNRFLFDLISGSVDFRIIDNLWTKFAPSMVAASSREIGISDAKFFKINTVNGMTALI